jgi:hypothetical protein
MDLTRLDQEDKPMRKAESKKSKSKPDNNKTDSSLEKGLDHITEELVEAAEEMERVSGEDSTLEDIEGAKTLASEALERYSAFEKSLDQRDKVRLEQSAKPVVERIKKGLTLLKEAPE